MLILCPECNREISDKAISCPHCGYPLNWKTKSKYKKSIYHFNFKKGLMGLNPQTKHFYFTLKNENTGKEYKYGADLIIDEPTKITISMGTAFNTIREVLIPPTDRSKSFYYEVSNFMFLKLRLVATYDYDPITNKDTKPEPPPGDDDLPF